MQMQVKDITRRAGKALGERQKHLRERTSSVLGRMRRRRAH